MLDALGPAQVRGVYHAVDSVLDLDEGTEVGEVADAALDDGTNRVLVFELLPGIFLELLHAERDAAVVRIDAQDNGVDLVTGLDHLRRMLHPVGTSHLRDVNEALDALLQFDECTVVGDRENAAANLCTDRVAFSRVQPWIRRQLLETQGNTLLILVELQYLHLNLVANIDEVAGMSESAPAH